MIDGVVSDVTEHRRAEEAVRQRDERFRALVERGSETIYLIDPTGQIRYASPAPCRASV